jgi:hypothetical protein
MRVEAAACHHGGSGELWSETVVVYWDGGSGAASRDTKVSLVLLFTLPPVAPSSLPLHALFFSMLKLGEALLIVYN